MAGARPVVLATGGTGGHVFPAEALASELEARGVPFTLVTDARGKQWQGALARQPVHYIHSASPTGSLQRRLLAVFSLGLGLLDAWWALGRIAPSAVVGFGGYASVPTMMAARLRRLPSMLHEQNAVLGRANKFLSRRVNQIATSFQGVKGIDVGTAAKVRFTGNPVRDIVLEWAREPYTSPEASGPYQILIFGGSQGARFFSDILPQTFATYSPEARSALRIVQQAREEDVARVEQMYKAAGIHAYVQSFFPNLPEAMAQSHLVIGRAGASTIAELTVMGRPSILVPLPNAIDNDQLINARRLADAGGAICLEQKDITVESLAMAIGQLLEAPEKLAVMAAAARNAGRPNSVVLLANLVEELMGRWTPATV